MAHTALTCPTHCIRSPLGDCILRILRASAPTVLLIALEQNPNRLYVAAMDAGNMAAVREVARCHEHGVGTPVDVGYAQQLYLRAEQTAEAADAAGLWAKADGAPRSHVHAREPHSREARLAEALESLQPQVRGWVALAFSHRSHPERRCLTIPLASEPRTVDHGIPARLVIIVHMACAVRVGARGC